MSAEVQSSQKFISECLAVDLLNTRTDYFNPRNIGICISQAVIQMLIFTNLQNKHIHIFQFEST